MAWCLNNMITSEALRGVCVMFYAMPANHAQTRKTGISQGPPGT